MGYETDEWENFEKSLKIGYETSELKNFEKSLEIIRNGELNWIKYAERWVNEHSKPEDEPKLIYAINVAESKGEESKLEKYINWISEGDFKWKEDAEELIEKHGDYRSEFDEAIEKGKEELKIAELYESSKEYCTAEN